MNWSTRLCTAYKNKDIFDDRETASFHSFSSGFLPALGAQSHSFLSVGRRIILPYDPRYRWWENFLVLLVIYTAWMSPFELGFLAIPPWPYIASDFVVDCFFAIDIILTFFVAYLDTKTYLLVDRRTKIASRYLKTWFTFDVASTIPVQVVALSQKSRQGLTYSALNMLRLWRLRRVGALFTRLEKDIHVSYFWIRCLKLLC